MGRLPVGIDGLTVYEIKGFLPRKIELLQEGSKCKPALQSGLGMLAHDLRTVKVLLSARRNDAVRGNQHHSV